MTPRILRAPWRPGPAALHVATDHDGDDHDHDGESREVRVSVTEFTADTRTRSLGVAVNGLRLRRTWPGTPGAVGMWLWVDPPRRRSGSVSVWTGQDALDGFVRRPDHVRIVRAFRGHGSVRATAWDTPGFDAAAVWDAALALITGDTPWPTARPRTGELRTAEPRTAEPRTGKEAR
ncbi:hypothetical protein AB0J38_11280 [Streptomyces sp. NPDC050095]|uniref:hypothetical protein n=1 Tax=unclassified Streptomyces TaxID=2593676 RepID=UPI00342EC28A